MSNLKPSNPNPKDAMGIKKAYYHVIPAPVIGELGLALFEGARKYGSYNWRVSGVRASVYYDALRRHLDSYWEGEDIDPDSGLPHIVKAMACLTVLRDSQIQGNHVDDRPPSTPEGWMTKLNQKASDLIDKYPNPMKANTNATQS